MTQEVWVCAVLDVCVLSAGRLRGDPEVSEGVVNQNHSAKKSTEEVSRLHVPESDTGRPPEYGKALEITLVKELGKLAP